VVVEVPGGSSELDVAFLEAWGLASSPPAGNLLRLSGPMDGGWRTQEPASRLSASGTIEKVHRCD
jgi:hypothetical protein